MIELTFNTLFILYLGLTVAFVLTVWMRTHYRLRKQTILPPDKTLQICEYCHFAYLQEDTKNAHRCPQCKLLNKS